MCLSASRTTDLMGLFQLAQSSESTKSGPMTFSWSVALSVSCPTSVRPATQVSSPKQPTFHNHRATAHSAFAGSLPVEGHCEKKAKGKIRDQPNAMLHGSGIVAAQSDRNPGLAVDRSPEQQRMRGA